MLKLFWQLVVLWWGWGSSPWILRGDSGDEKRQKKVQVEKDPEEPDSTGEQRRMVSMFCSICSFENLFFFFFQGVVKLDHPCIHVDFPIVLCEGWGVSPLWSSQHLTVQSDRITVRTGTHGSALENVEHSVLLKCYIELWLQRAALLTLTLLKMEKVYLTKQICNVSRVGEVSTLYFLREFFFFLPFAGRNYNDVKRL